MRNINRIDIFTEELNTIWKKNYPDWRFGQFMNNFFIWVYQEKKRDIFFPEENEMLDLLHEFCENN